MMSSKQIQNIYESEELKMKLSERISAIIAVAELHAQENIILADWYESTAKAAKDINTEVGNKISEFENIALALTALDPKVAVIDSSIIEGGTEALYNAIKLYDYSNTIYGGVIKASVDALVTIGEQLVAAVRNIAILEYAMNLRNDSSDVALTIEKPESFKTDEPEIIEPESEPEPESSETSETEEPVISSLREDPKETEPIENEPTLFGIPVSQLATTETEQEKIRRITEEPVVEKPVMPNKAQNPQDNPKGFIPIVIPGYPEDKFCLSPENAIVDRNHGRMYRANYKKHGKYYFRLKAPDGKSDVFFELEEIINLTRNTTETVDDKPVVDDDKPDDPYVWVDWFDGIPKRKYKVFKSGKVYDCVHQIYLPYDKKYETVRLSSGDIESRSVGTRSTVKALKRQSLVWQAFHPDYRCGDGRKKVYISFKDDNRQNCALENLYVGVSAPD
jgi:hypothetical protein